MYATPESKIKAALRSAAARRYDHDGAGGLPLRRDVFEFLGYYMLDQLPFDRAPDPAVTLNQDGTIQLAFDQDGLTLILTVKCPGVVTYLKVFPDGQTTIEGIVTDNPTHMDMNSFYHETRDLLAWVGGFAP